MGTQRTAACRISLRPVPTSFRSPNAVLMLPPRPLAPRLARRGLVVQDNAASAGARAPCAVPAWASHPAARFLRDGPRDFFRWAGRCRGHESARIWAMLPFSSDRIVIAGPPRRDDSFGSSSWISTGPPLPARIAVAARVFFIFIFFNFFFTEIYF
ncbi:hypothetical protein PVAP13_1KG470905 [Panicum virgatum]|uniref:Uncharacterized protein n=1 Tax=Panicum virgatum TaxID=38727 RepID=A0A8T0XHL7_PANVG|nr:hypothetical protein PVAP13_1KG470905 [Panicum virgatum]